MPDCLTDENPDFATIHRAKGKHYIAAIMRYRWDMDQYEIHVSWGPVSKAEAEAKAQRWAREYAIDYRA